MLATFITYFDESCDKIIAFSLCVAFSLADQQSTSWKEDGQQGSTKQTRG